MKVRTTMTAFIGASVLALFTGAASAAICTDPGAPLAGAIVGGTAGAVIGGPPGAAVGAVAGGAVGGATGPKTVCNYVVEQEVPATTIEREIVVGEPLPQTVVLHPIPEYKTYEFAYVNGRRVLVDPKTHVVVEIVR